MKIEFYGVRGSMPTPGKNTVLFGGNTSCVYVELNNGDFVILDSGTGITKLNKKLNHYKETINILVTHSHWDHIQGFPYFHPIYCPSTKINIITGIMDNNDNDMILKQMSGSSHPVKYNELPSSITLNAISSPQSKFKLNDFIITTQALNHPDGGSAYCLQGDNQKIAYVTDNELIPPASAATTWDEWIKFISDADVLIHDAQYNNHDMPLKHGWGHSTYEQVMKLAIQANVKQLFFISHDPCRTDQELLAQEQSIQSKNTGITQIACAKEDSTFDLNTMSLR
ncbi:MBL fold metallo-hydrolase [Pseudocolwellia agarivorans]|uniref:MBL fold metallo-hydrolase n=1 Tax=Pseudocolwellia agarivorans TaxID=1911682 RepID=UPI001FEA3B51|nr:MBL fold metallo-hydrolase [Pseudocolwellia agarivorans]